MSEPINRNQSKGKKKKTNPAANLVASILEMIAVLAVMGYYVLNNIELNWIMLSLLIFGGFLLFTFSLFSAIRDFKAVRKLKEPQEVEQDE